MVRENNADANKTWVYTYDLSGNITTRDVYDYTTGPLPIACQSFDFYDYSAGQWGDLLTTFNATDITYDAIGNPLNWRNATTLEWNGRKLTKQTLSSDKALTYSYNSDGIRTEKRLTDSSISQYYSHNYTLDGSRIVYEKYMIVGIGGHAEHNLYYYYDESGVCGFEYNGTPYYFLKNIQGDVISILNASGQLVVSYTYDAWGKVLSVTGTLASTIGTINPFRYRGYYYDTETGFYYVSSRYYDPEIGRWINADIPETLTADFENSAQYNLFAYCFNNPVNMSDETGTWPSWSSLATKIAIGVGAVLIGAAVVAATAATGGAAAAFVGAAVTGLKAAAVSGAISAAVGAGTSAVSHRVSTGSWKGAEKAALDGAVNGFADGFMTGGITAGVGMSVGALGKTSSGIQIGKTAKPQYGKVNAGYGTPKTNGNTLISIQNNAGKRIFSLDLDSLHAVHMHLPKIFPKAHIPIGAIGSGIYAGARQW